MNTLGRPRGITLIGMPGAGKSTIGVLLSKALALDFLDSDVAIQVREKRILQDILDSEGYLALRQIEEDVLLAIDPSNLVLATGGSAVYSALALEHLSRHSSVVYLQASAETLRKRIHNYDTRGIARRPDQSFEDLFAERTALYRRYAQLTVAVDNASPDDVVNAIIEGLASL